MHSKAQVLVTTVQATYCAPTTNMTAGDLKQLVRADFDRHRIAKDLYSVKYHLSDGRVQLKQLQETLAMKY